MTEKPVRSQEMESLVDREHLGTHDHVEAHSRWETAESSDLSPLVGKRPRAESTARVAKAEKVVRLPVLFPAPRAVQLDPYRVLPSVLEPVSDEKTLVQKEEHPTPEEKRQAMSQN